MSLPSAISACTWLGLSLAVGSAAGCSPHRTLASAVESGEDAVRAYLASTTVGLDARDLVGEAPIHSAALRCDAPVITVLAAHGANVGALDSRGRTPLGITADLACTEATYALVVAGADVNQPTWPEGARPLHVAAARSALPIVELLVRSGADVTLTNAWGQTPLHFASHAPQWHTEPVAAFLLSRGAALEAVDVQGFTPLHAAAARDSDAVVEQLLALGAHVDARTKRGSTPLDLALELHSDVAAERLLAMHAPQVQSHTLPPLHQAAGVDDADWALRLLSYGADPSLVADGRTALDVAREKKSEQVEALLTDQRRSRLAPSVAPPR